MTINSLSGYSSTSYGYLNASRQDNQNQEGKIQQGPKGPGGPGRNAKPPKGPKLDTDNDGNWSKDELDEYAAYSSEELGVSIDSEDLMNTYDQDGDGLIGSEEREVLIQDNALKLPEMPSKPPMAKGAMPPMGNATQGPDLDTNEDDSWSISELENYAAFVENLGISIDISEIMEAFDEDEDGTINGNERELLAEENGLQLPEIESYTFSQGINAYTTNVQFYSTEELV
ncbi:EF-hand domain-containing protein [Vallitalea okinawensis]|uniref:EF-hand domain-containing protein n=1 Tax=Vallitalea okinawensis TaxID=2078660 RepID=UPI000CFE2BB3|nr:EF-hand domain-containing protein [Vallitalea okinawensis]